MSCEIWKVTAIGAAVPFLVIIFVEGFLRTAFGEWWNMGWRTAATLRPLLPFLAVSFIVLLLATLVLAAHCDPA